jgi:hypothetical protein
MGAQAAAHAKGITFKPRPCGAAKPMRPLAVGTTTTIPRPAARRGTASTLVSVKE